MEENSKPPRTQARKAVTRARIIAAANALFQDKGYDATSVEDIAVAAEIATRTIYLHFDSKASILLAYLDEWIDSFVGELLQRPIEEQIDDSIIAVLASGDRARWVNPAFGESPSQHPISSFIGSGSLEIAGRMMHSWVAAQDRIAADAQQRGNYPPGSLEPRARAAAVFATWMAAVLIFREGHQRNGFPGETRGRDVAVDLAHMLGGWRS